MPRTITREDLNYKDIFLHIDSMKNTIQREMNALINSPGGYFSIPLIFFSIAYEMSEKLLGYRINGGGALSGGIQKELYFLTTYLPKIDPIYSKESIEHFDNIYRNGLAHRFTPQHIRFENDEQLTWCCYLGERNDYKFNRDNKIQTLDHFRMIKRWDKNEPGNDQFPDFNVYFLPICLHALRNDLLTALDLYLNDLRTDDKLVVNFNKWKNDVFFKPKPGVVKKTPSP